MKWKTPQTNLKQPTKGCYRDWKEKIAKKCHYQCVYCAIHENNFGGIRNFNIEHYKPKSLFPKLMNKISNLLYACTICNVFKGNDWPNDPCPQFSNISYPNPSEIDYNKLFIVSHSNGKVKGSYVTSKYLTEKLYLNRPQLIIIRRKFFIGSEIQKFEDFFENTVKPLHKRSDRILEKYVQEFMNLLIESLSLWKKLCEMRPYALSDTKRRQ